MAVAKRLLKDISDAVIMPSAETLYARATEKVAQAKSVLDGIEREQHKYEGGNARTAAVIDDFVARKKVAKLAIERAEFEAFAAKAPIIAARQQRDLLPHEKVLRDASVFRDVYEHCKRSTPAKVAEAEEGLKSAIIAWKLAEQHQRDEAMLKLEQARLRLAVRQGPPYSERLFRRLGKQAFEAMRKSEGLD